MDNMKIAFYVNIVSPHQIPLADELAKRVGPGNFRYVYWEKFHAERAKMGWGLLEREWISDDKKLLENADVIYTATRDVELIERWLRAGKRVFYYGERWFKPVLVPSALCLVLRVLMKYSGRLRMLVPGYRRMAKRFVGLAREYECFKVLPMGVHALRDFEWLGVPREKMELWGYFVAPGAQRHEACSVKHEACEERTLKVLWVGRMLGLKRIEDVIRAVRRVNGRVEREKGRTRRVELTIVGNGPERVRLEKLAEQLEGRARGTRAPSVTFRDSVPLAEVRTLMREHDVFVMASNAYEGWGAVVSEALEEGMAVVGTEEAGASATMLPEEYRYRAGDFEKLEKILVEMDVDGCRRKEHEIYFNKWTVVKAAERLMEI